MKAFEEKKHEQQGVSGFHVAGRGLSAAEKKSFPWATIMQDSDGEILVPDVFLAPIQETSFVNLALRVLVANPLEMIDYERMMDLFSALMLNIYDFENDFMKKNKLDEVAIANHLSCTLLTEGLIRRQPESGPLPTGNLSRPPKK